MSILNTMTNEILSAQTLLNGTGISLLDAARLIRNALDAKPGGCEISDVQFCSNVIETGKRHLRTSEASPQDAFGPYLKAKSHLRPDSYRDVRYLGNRLMKSRPDLAKKNFSELSVSDCEAWLSASFSTPSQFNKGRAMLHGLFEFALRREWCCKNPVRLVERRRILEKEIKPLSLIQTKRLLKTSKKPKYADCSAGVAILALAGVRPREIRRLKWGDIDLEESFITIRSICSKTGGVRHVEICPALKKFLRESKNKRDSYVCPPNWSRRWRKIRDDSGFKGRWIQDVLRHTYASHHAKCFQNLPRLQLNMGHRDQTLLRSRYVNMSDISKFEARKFFWESAN